MPALPLAVLHTTGPTDSVPIAMTTSVMFAAVALGATLITLASLASVAPGLPGQPPLALAVE
jgi:hypothetical protein